MATVGCRLRLAPGESEQGRRNPEHGEQIGREAGAKQMPCTHKHKDDDLWSLIAARPMCGVSARARTGAPTAA